jgi:hypothetical protein
MLFSQQFGQIEWEMGIFHLGLLYDGVLIIFYFPSFLINGKFILFLDIKWTCNLFNIVSILI